MLKYFASLYFLLFVLSGCGISKKATIATEKITSAKLTIIRDSLFIDTLQSKLEQQIANNNLDTAVKDQIFSVITKLQNDLTKIEETINAADLIAQNKSTFRGKKYQAYTSNYLRPLDSFKLKENFRERIYQLLNEAVTIEAFRKYQMGAFFDKGAYKMPLTALNQISTYFQPAIDSIISQSNRYSDIRRRIYIVLVGYADGVAINPNTPLYKMLTAYSNTTNPDKEHLNLILSTLRANELLHHIKFLVKENAGNFKGFNQLNIGYVGYGRGEAFPFKNITDYREDDERRRVVVFYWSILPDL